MNAFENNGYVIKSQFINAEACSEIQSTVSSSSPVVFEQFSSTPLARGWGNLISNKRMTELIKFDKINEITKYLTFCFIKVKNFIFNWLHANRIKIKYCMKIKIPLILIEIR